MTATVTDLFCGAGGSSLGAELAGAQLVMAANHWQTAIDVHQAHFPDAGHDCADISQADPRRYPRTDILLASPECTNHSQARGVSRKRQDPSLFDSADLSAERSRATMWDVVRFAEQMHYAAVVVENVVEATKWVLWPAWYQAMQSLGYRATILSHNSMHHGVPQSRDRIYVVWVRDGLRPNLELEHTAWCSRCDRARPVRQAWKQGRRVGRYRQQWTWSCTTCGATCEPATEAAATIIDWALDCPRIGDRARPLAPATRARILAGLERYGWTAITTSGAGNVHERTPGNRARSVDEPLATQQTTATSALATPPGFLVGTNRTTHGHRLHPLDAPHPVVCASDDRLSLVVAMRGTDRSHVESAAQPVDRPLRTVFGERSPRRPCGPELRQPWWQPWSTRHTGLGAGADRHHPARDGAADAQQHGLRTWRDVHACRATGAVDDHEGPPVAARALQPHSERPARRAADTHHDDARPRRPRRPRNDRRRLRVQDVGAVRGRRGDGVPARLHPARSPEEGPGEARRQRRDAAGDDVDRRPAPASPRGRGMNAGPVIVLIVIVCLGPILAVGIFPGLHEYLRRHDPSCDDTATTEAGDAGA